MRWTILVTCAIAVITAAASVACGAVSPATARQQALLQPAPVTPGENIITREHPSIPHKLLQQAPATSGEKGDALSVTVEASDEIGDGEIILFKVRVENTGDQDISVWWQDNPLELVVSDEDGTEVWRSLLQDMPERAQDFRVREFMDSGDTEEFEAYWGKADAEGNPLPDGEYMVRALFSVAVSTENYLLETEGIETFESEPHQFHIESRPSQEKLRVFLDVPDKVEHGAWVPMKLYVKNTSNERLPIWSHGALYYFTVTNEQGEQVWLAPLEYDNPGDVERFRPHMDLEPGEVKKFQERWYQTNFDGDDVGQGVYKIRAHFRASLDSNAENLKSYDPAPQEVVVSRMRHPASYFGFGIDTPEDVPLGGKATLGFEIWNLDDFSWEAPLLSPPFDFTVSRYDSTEIIWRWSEEHKPGEEPFKLRLGPGESRRYEAEWNLVDSQGNPVPRGIYRVTGFFRPDGGKADYADEEMIFVGPRPTLDEIVDVWLEAPSKAEPGEPVILKLMVKSTWDHTITLWTGANPHSFSITHEDGTDAWKWPHRWVLLILASLRLEPGEVKEYEVEWDQRDNECVREVLGGSCLGNPLPAGTYLLHATLEASITDGAEMETIELGPHRIEIPGQPSGPEPLTSSITVDGLAYSARTEIAGASPLTLRTMVSITNTTASRVTTNVAGDCPIRLFGYTDASRRDTRSMDIDYIPEYRCVLDELWFELEPGETREFHSELAASELLEVTPNAKRYYFTVWIPRQESSVFLAAGDVELD